jgi:hypothetical protein
MFVIEDEAHADQIGEYATFEEAIAELRRRAALPWDEAPNVAPCRSWRTCGRRYQIIECNPSTVPWTELRCLPALDISARGAKWLLDPGH